MKNSNYIINGILIVAVIVLFILQFTGRRADTKHPETTDAVTDSSDFHLPIAYVRTDSLLSNYNFFNDLNDEMMKKRDDKRLLIKRRDDKFTKEYLDFQEKIEKNVFLSRERQLQEQNNLVRQQQELQEYVASIDRELSLEQAKMIQQLQDTIAVAVKEFNTPRKYEMILNNAGTDNILYADDSYDITIEFTEFLNARYVPEKK